MEPAKLAILPCLLLLRLVGSRETAMTAAEVSALGIVSRTDVVAPAQGAAVATKVPPSKPGAKAPGEATTWCRHGRRSDNLCCAASCEVCGSTGCSGACCLEDIKRQGFCRDGADVTCQIPIEVVVPSGEPSIIPWCSRGKRSGDICCDASCDVCSGERCYGICCERHIAQQGFCKDGRDVTCRIPREIASPPVPATGQWCSRGKTSGNLCCHSSCDPCTGPGCVGFCCGNNIKMRGFCEKADDVTCEIPIGTTLAADPAQVEIPIGTTLAADPAQVEWCSRGKRSGAVCCEASCAICAGPGCMGSCCGYHIKSQGLCKDFHDVTCVVPTGG
eukprot:gnl/TRDRNA2_/TRDRNA2_175794_c7_seq7.p1 gnl/TRDRNA2_/TRDRNA2_175794_c7~~gnl/TRDRNA2_/TRDRNA2_175794_c7_seq7.p1  ORF type:complete len:332 (-),score=43.44 gnl/TRDRNA2_/TRDRNA2_175794_c7_seq7:42-1037(-)